MGNKVCVPACGGSVSDELPSIGSRAAAQLFILRKQLGAGAWSSVYLVERRYDSKLFALKSTRTTELTETQRWICVNEIRLMASLDHPNVVAWHEGFLDGPWLCIVAEYVSGGDLSELVKRHRKAGTHIPEPKLWGYALQLCLGLAYLHKSGVVHRDIKPANVLLTPSGFLKLADLGVAGVLRGGSSALQIGTPGYMPPEMYRREPYSFSADIWSLGCTLHELCTGRQLFVAPTEEELGEHVLAAAWPPPRIPDAYSEELNTLIASMLAPDPAARPTAESLLHLPELLERGVAGLPPQLVDYLPSANELSSSGSEVLPPIEVPCSAAHFHSLNGLLPLPRYSMDGEGGVLGIINSANALGTVRGPYCLRTSRPVAPSQAALEVGGSGRGGKGSQQSEAGASGMDVLDPMESTTTLASAVATAAGGSTCCISGFVASEAGGSSAAVGGGHAPMLIRNFSPRGRPLPVSPFAQQQQ